MFDGLFPKMKLLLPNPVDIDSMSLSVDDGATKLNINKVFVGGLHYQTTQGRLIFDGISPARRSY